MSELALHSADIEIFRSVGLKEEDKTFRVLGKTLKDAVSACGKAFFIAKQRQVEDSHLNWIIGDILNDSSSRFGDSFDQEISQFSDEVGWSRRRILDRQHTAEVFGHHELRKYSYSLEAWEAAYGNEGGVETMPLQWRHYREIAKVKSADGLLTMLNMLHIAWVLGLSPSDSKASLAALVAQEKDVRALRELVDNEPSEVAEQIEIAKDASKVILGPYLIITNGKPERFHELTPARYEEADITFLLKGRKVLQVTDYDGFNEEYKEVKD